MTISSNISSKGHQMKLEGTRQDTSSCEELFDYGVATGSCGCNRQVQLIKTSARDHFRHCRDLPDLPAAPVG